MTVPTAPPTADEVLAALDPEQRAVATALHGPVCVLAGAGTGKTRALTSRIAYGVLSGAYAAPRVLAVTFTTRAAGELRGRLRSMGVAGVQARTFHSAALRQLRYFWPQAVGGAMPGIVDAKGPLVAQAARSLGLRATRDAVRDLAAEVEWVAVTLTDHDRYPEVVERLGRTPPAGFEAVQVARLLPAYQELKRERDVLDLEDVLVLTVGMLADRADVAARVREQYTHLLVDEYQDVSPLQQRLLELWLGGRDDLCVVGDPAQTIYSFAGASPQHLVEFPRRYPGATVVRLVRDYRSTPQVVGVANRLLLGRPETPHVDLVAQRPDGPPPVFAEHADEVAEAAATAAAVRGLVASGVAAREIAVLFRTNGQSETYEQALADAGIPYVVRGGARFFSRPEVRQAVLLLRGAAKTVEDAGAAAGELPAVVRAVLGGTGWTPQPPDGGGAVRDRWESLAALVRLADDLAAARAGATLRDLVDDLDARAEAQHAPAVDGVTLASLHAAKGLEWDAVFLVGLSEGLLPITYATTPEAVAEELRLLYVGVTRARVHLRLSWALARSPGGSRSRRPSRFLDALPGAREVSAALGERPAGRARPGRSGRSRTAATCRVCQRPLLTGADRKLGRHADCASSYDEALYERLRAWRLEESRRASVPAFVVFTDATLTAIAESVPRTSAALARVPGVGAAKLERYGEAVLALTSEAAADDVVHVADG